MDEPNLPDEWGYDYTEQRFWSPMMKRSLVLAVVPLLFLFLLILLLVLLGVVA
jgi:hypothetical protein